MANYCTNCGAQLSNSDKFCHNCGQKVECGSSGTQTSGISQTGKQSKKSIKASNFFVPILIMFVGGWICGFIAQIFFPNESVVHVGTIVYLGLSGIYIMSCHNSLDKKHSAIASQRSIFVMFCGIGELLLAFYTYATENIVLAFVLFFVALIIMIISSFLDSTAPDWD